MMGGKWQNYHVLVSGIILSKRNPVSIQTLKLWTVISNCNLKGIPAIMFHFHSLKRFFCKRWSMENLPFQFLLSSYLFICFPFFYFRIKMNNLNNSSQIVQRYFVQSVFIMVDIAIKEGCLFCDTLCDQGPVKKGQVCVFGELSSYFTYSKSIMSHILNQKCFSSFVSHIDFSVSSVWETIGCHWTFWLVEW